MSEELLMNQSKGWNNRETAVSLFIFSPRTSNVSNFINKINCLKRGCKYKRVGDSDQVIRIDYVFTEESYQKTFRNKVTNLPRPQELVLEMKSVPEEVLLHREEPVLSEEELLWICSQSLAEKNFKGSFILVEDGDEFRFDFGSMTTLNIFLVDAVGYKDCFLGEIRKRAEAVSPQLKSIKSMENLNTPSL